MKKTFISQSVLFTSLFISSSFGLFASLPDRAMALAQVPPGLLSSNVIFLPGIEGSRLYTRGVVSENQLWEPNANVDAYTLRLDASGRSLDPNIYTRDIINRTNIGFGPFDKFNQNVYQKFSDSMNQLISGRIINAWEPIPYDWRRDYDDLINNGTNLADGQHLNLPDEVERMASSSKTGKVTIITHSNGGLLAKALLTYLQSKNKASLVDKLIMIAPPELGTPESVAALLHGDEQDIEIKGYPLMSKNVARDLSENMPTAYDLSPSSIYFNNVSAPVIQFDPSVDKVNNLRSLYGNNIKNYSNLSSFLLAAKDHREKPAELDTDDPNVLNSGLLTAARNNHNKLDSWSIPVGLQVSRIAGWGIPTTSGIEYSGKENCILDVVDCTYTLDHRLLKTTDGDGTVVSPSVISNTGTEYYFNIHQSNIQNQANISHSNILENQSVEDLIKNIITNTTSSLPIFITTTKPSGDDISMELSVHSPVSIEAYDNAGNHTGLISDATWTSDLQPVEENIPNSSYEESGDGKYLNIPDGNYKIKLVGLDTGSFTLEETSKQGDTQLSDNVFSDIPTTPMMTGELNFTATSSGSVTPVLSIDADGDGTVDATMTPATEINPAYYLLLIKKVISGLNINDPLKTRILNKIDNILGLISQGKVKNANKKIKAFNHSLELKIAKHKKHGRISDDDAKILADLLEKLLNNLGS